MPNTFGNFGFVKKTGDVMTGDLNLGLNSLVLSNGSYGGRVRGNPAVANEVQVREIANTGYANFRQYGAILMGSITMDEGQTVDGVDISELVKNLYQVKADTGDHQSHSGDTNETTLKSYIIPGGTLGINGVIRIKATGRSYGNLGDKTYRLKLGGVTKATLVQAANPSAAYWALFAACHNKGAEDSQGWSYLWIDETTIDSNETLSGTDINTAVDQTLEITVQLADGADQGGVVDWTIEINPT